MYFSALRALGGMSQVCWHLNSGDLPALYVLISAERALFSSSITLRSASSSASFSGGKESMFDWFATKNVVFPEIYAGN